MTRRERSGEIWDKRGQGELESEVLGVLWAAEGALTAGQVQTELDAGLAYNTVLTTLGRLLEKDLVQREKTGRAHAYRPTRAHAAHTAGQMREHLLRGPDHAAVLAQFLSGLDAADAQVLRDLLEDLPDQPSPGRG